MSFVQLSYLRVYIKLLIFLEEYIRTIKWWAAVGSDLARIFYYNKFGII